MARRSDHSREQLYELALDAAAMIVERDGFRALTARNVADVIGYSVGTLYNLFENLDDIIVHLNGRTIDRLGDALAAVVFSGNPTDDLCRLAETYIAFLEAHPNLWAVLFDHRMPEGSEMPEWYTTKIALVMSRVEIALAPLFEEEANKKQDGQEQQEIARVLWTSVHGICSLSQTGKLQIVTAQSAVAMTRVLISNFIAGLSIRTREG